MVRHDQARFPQQEIEGKVFQTLEGVSAREDREATVCQDGNVPEIPYSCPGTMDINRKRFGIDCRKKAVAFESFGTHRREDTLGEDHNRVMMDAGSHLMISHSRLSQLGFVVQDLGRRRPKLCSYVVTAVNRYGKTSCFMSEEVTR